MPLAYLDQNALINLGRKSRTGEFAQKLRTRVESREVIFVLSPWHWVETSRTANIKNATELGNFMDFLTPQWLCDRRDLQRIEVAADFFHFAKLPFARPEVLTSRQLIIAKMNGKEDGAEFDISSATMAEEMIRRPELVKTIEEAHRANSRALESLRSALKTGKLTPEIRAESNRKHIEELLPAKTPAGLEVGRDLRSAYLKHASFGNLPTLAIEEAIAEQSWKTTGEADWNTMIDKFHLISGLPYVDEIVTDDQFFEKMYPVAQGTGHVRAKLMKTAQFLSTI